LKTNYNITTESSFFSSSSSSFYTCPVYARITRATVLFDILNGMLLTDFGTKKGIWKSYLPESDTPTRVHTHTLPRACPEGGWVVCTRVSVALEGNGVFKFLLLCPKEVSIIFSVTFCRFFIKTVKLSGLIETKRGRDREREIQREMLCAQMFHKSTK